MVVAVSLDAIVFGLLSSASAATISIRDFGASGDGVADDSAAIQKTIHSSTAGDTILFPVGTYRISRPIALVNDRIYQGQSATVKREAGDFVFVMPYNSAVNITVSGLTFDGGGIRIDGADVPANNISVTKCVFQNILSGNANWTTHNGIFTSGMTNSAIAKNQFSNISEGGDVSPKDTFANGIMAYNLANISITDNIFDSVNEGIKLVFNGDGPYPGVILARNVGTRIHRMGIEAQGSNTQGMVVDSNQFSNFLNPFWNTFGLSIVVDGGFDTIIRNNVVDANTAATTGGRYGYGIEASGIRTQVTGNTIRNLFWSGISIGRAPNIEVTSNYLCGPGNATTVSYEVGAQPDAVIRGNTTQPVCASTAFAIVTRPAANTTLSGTVQLAAQASAPTVLKYVRFVLNGSQVLGDVESPPYVLNVDTTQITNGRYSLQAIAVDGTSTQGISAAVPIEIRNETVSVTTPAQKVLAPAKAKSVLKARVLPGQRLRLRRSCLNMHPRPSSG